MKVLLFLVGAVALPLWADTFEKDAAALAGRLKKNLMTTVTDKMNKEGAVAAIPFCHEEVKPLAKEAAGADFEKFSFGRTSHKTRNKANRPEPWMKSYLQRFKETRFDPEGTTGLVHTFDNGKRAYVEPLYVMPPCLQCHGESLKPEVKKAITKLYPKDEATGFKLGSFRGLIWVKEK
jgi:hypothetical protein